MSVEAMAIVLHHSRASGTAKVVLIGIANHEGDGGAWPTIATLARYANVSPRNAKRAVQTLLDLGEVHVAVQGGGSATLLDSQRPNLYTVRVTCPPWCDRTANHRDTRQTSKQSALWKNPVTESTPGVEIVTRGVSESSPGGVSESSPKPSIEPSMNLVVGDNSGTDRAGAEYCGTCALTRDECERRSLFHFDHAFTPKAKRA